MPRCLVVVVVAVLATGGCGEPTSRGAPGAVVRTAPDRTFAHTAAHVEAAAPDARSQGRVSFAGAAPLRPSGAGAAKDHAELVRPLALVDLVRGAAEVKAYGGTAVRGVSTFRYEAVLDVDLAVRRTPEPRRAEVQDVAAQLGARTFYADVWVDARGRIRRVQVPVEKTRERPRGRERPPLITVDLFAFEPP